MKKIDGHLHLVRNIAGLNGKGRLNALGNGQAIWDDGTVIQLIPNGSGADSFSAESAMKLMDQADVEKAVLLQGSLNGYQNYYSYQMIKKYPERFIGAFSVDPFADNAMAIVKRHVEDLGFRAIKFEISQGGGLHGYHSEKPFRLDTDPKVGEIFHYLADYPGFTVTVDYGKADQISYQPEAIANLAAHYSAMTFVVCHLSFPDYDHQNRLVAALRLFAPYPNIYSDLSAIQDIVGETDFPYPKCQAVLALAKKVLGAKRLIWGTDSPWSATFNTYGQLATYLEASDLFNESELEDVLYHNAERVYFNQQAIQAVKEASDPALQQ
ncbi:amidohydrolase [Fructobacillus sp. M1-13]|uniref:Amidohydrolase n=1 Tax=Fructobacillus papyriferae TaxID=2713171 RepID=A0ABS5QNE8_9LACO|nr:amidohydrolase family protein [Fructobacillus papyriferae]MBS9334628.1 amidohydrolase [Fructobacillus papyriferae]MCD2158618.1 amidohydrolase [Fructobacillus papyriferae]